MKIAPKHVISRSKTNKKNYEEGIAPSRISPLKERDPLSIPPHPWQNMSFGAPRAKLMPSACFTLAMALVLHIDHTVLDNRHVQ